MIQQYTFPFSAIIGQEPFKHALLLTMVDPSIGGVLAVGDKGTGKTTLIRSLSALLSQKNEVPFVNLPIGASEDRVLGSIQLSTLINEKKEVVQQGLLAKAHKGLLYIDEVNLLNDYLMDVLLDAAAMGSYYLEREGLSLKMDSRFCLIGSMNPEEGALRPQLKDRFGLSIRIHTPNNTQERMSIVRNRLDFDTDPEKFCQQYAPKEQAIINQLNQAIAILDHYQLNDHIIHYCSNLALQNNVEGIRADILLMKTARAHAALHGKAIVSTDDVDAIANLVLDHRRRPLNDTPKPSASDQQSQRNRFEKIAAAQTIFEPALPENKMKKVVSENSKRKGNASKAAINTSTNSPEPKIDLRKTVGQYVTTQKFEVIPKYQEAKINQHFILLLDSTGSMRKDKVITYAKGFIKKMVLENEGARMIFSLIAMYNNDAKITVKKSTNTGIILDAIQKIPTGGKTNIIAAMKSLKSVVSVEEKTKNQLLFITDGRFGEGNPEDIQQAVLAYQLYGKAIEKTTLVDAESGPVHLGYVKTFAIGIGAAYEQLILSKK